MLCYICAVKNSPRCCAICQLGRWVVLKTTQPTYNPENQLLTTLYSLLTNNYLKRLKATTNPAVITERILISFIRILSEGPEVSFIGSPRVSPVTAAL